MDFKLNKSNLNFSVKTAEAVPTNPGKENDIVVISSVQMKNWILSPDAPAGAPRNDGDVWLQYSVTGDVLNAVKTGSLLFVIFKSFQYVSGVWNTVNSAIYRDVEWKPFFVHLYNAGDLCTEITGGWEYKNASNSNGCIIVSNSAGLNGARTKNKIDFTGKRTLVAKVSVPIESSAEPSIAIALSDNTTLDNSSDGTVIKGYPTRQSEAITFSMDISKITGSYYVKLFSYYCEARFYEIYVE